MDFILRLIHDLTQVHPPHTMVVHFPIALTGAALFFILVALWRFGTTMEKVAFANLSLAAVSTVVAAIFGIRDNMAFYAGGAPNHLVKIILAITLFIVTTITVVVRMRKKDLFHNRNNKFARTMYVASYFVSFAIAAVLGFLGGVIIYGF